MAGRNTKLTEQLSAEICNDIKAGVPFKHAAISHGVTEQTFYNWYKKGKEAQRKTKFRDFYEAVEEAKSIAITLRARRVYEAGKTSWQADAWWLERMDPENFGAKEKYEAKIEHKGLQGLAEAIERSRKD